MGISVILLQMLLQDTERKPLAIFISILCRFFVSCEELLVIPV